MGNTARSGGTDIRLTAGVASQIAGVCARTLARMADRGDLVDVERTQGGKNRTYSDSEIRELARQRGRS